jgi:hypothetical protein
LSPGLFAPSPIHSSASFALPRYQGSSALPRYQGSSALPRYQGRAKDRQKYPGTPLGVLW